MTRCRHRSNRLPEAAIPGLRPRRAGRDGLPSRAILLHSYGDIRTHEFFLGRDYPETPVVEEIFRVVQELNHAGVTVLLVEQNARAALRIAHHGYVLETGRVVMSASAHELLSDDAVRKAYLRR